MASGGHPLGFWVDLLLSYWRVCHCPPPCEGVNLEHGGQGRGPVGHRQGRQCRLSSPITGTNQAETIQCFCTQSGRQGKAREGLQPHGVQTYRNRESPAQERRKNTETGKVQARCWAKSTEGLNRVTTQVDTEQACSKYIPLDYKALTGSPL